MTPVPLKLDPGACIDGWQVVRELGEGGFARVFLGEKQGRRSAIKVARHREASGDIRQTHARTMRELTALLLLEHPNIVRVQGHGFTESGNVYLALDYVEGWTLAEWAERKHPTVRELLAVFEKLAAALSYMHGRGILHRDLKLSNVLVRKRDGEPILIDFSCAVHALAERLTNDGLPPGTDSYRAPEQFQFLREHRDEHRARYAFQVADELFAVGVMLHELLTEPRPTAFHPRLDLNYPQVEPLPAREVNGRVPEQLSDLVESLLSRTPGMRPVDTEALRRELAELQADPVARYDVPVHPPSEQRRSALEAHGALSALPHPPASGERHGAQAATPRRAGRWLAAGAGVAALALAATLWGAVPTRPVEPRASVMSAPPGAAHSAPLAVSAPAMSPPGSGPSPVAVPGPASAAVQKEGSTVKTPSPEVTTQGRPPRALKKKAAIAVECASLSLAAALSAGCPGAQVRPEPFTCPEASLEAMSEHLRWSIPERFVLNLDARYESDEEVWFTTGAEVVGIVPKGVQIRRQVEYTPHGTRFYGKAYYLSEKLGRDPSLPTPALVIRYDRVKLPGQDEQPVCFVVEQSVLEVKDGRVKARNAQAGVTVFRWP
ncbi:serine/threonine protein kinase [Myxococcus sp. SDU36]|uniref:serine/threonine protein kinase n=1 Tax=Myxococcus sp. SDU36 TaxID=2831967 RepID=UPI0025436FF4|nr:serine/threonine protein kinase [Myxococcus sp. SDU36]WIG94641.1 protein kinase [Myxococcus sp. SDU36]